MGTRLTATQRRAVAEADPATGRLAARAEVCAALAAAGLAVRHGRGGHPTHYLTQEGRRLRADLTRAEPADPPASSGQTARVRPAGGFAADDGTGTTVTDAGADPDRRAAEVATAWQGLLQIRAVLADGATGLPAPWERERAVHAVALALEAVGCPPSRPDVPGYRVTRSGHHPGATEVVWTSPDPDASAAALARCADLLARHGWQSTRHRTRDRVPFLLVTPANR